MTTAQLIRLIRVNRDGAQLGETMDKLAGDAFRAVGQGVRALNTAGRNLETGLGAMGVKNSLARGAARWSPHAAAAVGVNSAYNSDAADSLRQKVFNFRASRLMKQRQRESMAQQLAQLRGGQG